MNMEKNPEIYTNICSELSEMVKVDQKMRKDALEDLGKWDDTIDKKNTDRLKEIIEEIGWPTISKVGKEGAANAWLLAQHADHDIDFQKYCLKLISEQSTKEISLRNMAYLDDRIAISENRPQLYGTQFCRNPEGNMVPLPIFEPERVEYRRNKMGLNTFLEYKEHMQQYNKKTE